jgi:hypothetical protein
MSAAAKWSIALLICGASIIISYLFFDRPFAYFAHDELRGYRPIFDSVGRLPNVLGPLVIGCTLIFGVRAVMGRPLTEMQTSVVLSALSLALAAILESWLKLAFGHTWPETCGEKRFVYGILGTVDDVLKRVVARFPENKAFRYASISTGSF